MKTYKITLTTKVKADNQEEAELKAFENLEIGKFNMEVEE